MRHLARTAAAGSLLLVLGVAGGVLAQDSFKPDPKASFFVTSVGGGKGGDLGGLAGADVHCADLAKAAGITGKTWKAYLSTSGAGGVNAKDRIGKGPWFNAKERIPDYLGRRLQRPIIGSEIHGDTLDEARRGSNLTKEFAVTEKGELINGIGDPLPTRHDLLTGTQPDGRAYTDTTDHTCNNWTSSSTGSAQVGHSDRIGNGSSWNSSNATKGCSQADLEGTGGTGLFYCFAIN